MSGLRYGRLAAMRPVGLRDIFHYLNNPLPSGPTSVVAPTFDWGMLGNDKYGDCTLAAVVHLREACSVKDHVPETWPSADQVVHTYLTMTHGADTGLVEANVLSTWRTTGLFGDRIVGYAPQDHRNDDELRSVVAAFGASYLGVAVPAPAQQQFAAGEPWDLTGTSADQQIEGGHAVPAVGYDADYVYVVTWAKVQPVTWRWLDVYCQEAWAVLTSESAHVDLQSLQADLAALQ